LKDRECTFISNHMSQRVLREKSSWRHSQMNLVRFLHCTFPYKINGAKQTKFVFDRKQAHQDSFTTWLHLYEASDHSNPILCTGIKLGIYRCTVWATNYITSVNQERLYRISIVYNVTHNPRTVQTLHIRVRHGNDRYEYCTSRWTSRTPGTAENDIIQRYHRVDWFIETSIWRRLQ
jgi:hypothetical protein